VGARVSVALLLDNSAFVRRASPALEERPAHEIADALEQRLVGVCLPFLLEAGYSARSAADHDELLRELMALPMLHMSGWPAVARYEEGQASGASVLRLTYVAASSRRAETATR
jgi:hypothetical protein